MASAACNNNPVSPRSPELISIPRCKPVFHTRLDLKIIALTTLLPVHHSLNADEAWSERSFTPVTPEHGYTGYLHNDQLQSFIRYGELLFNARFTSNEGVGRPMATQAIIPTKRKRPPRQEFSRTAGLDANACASCHNVPRVGGAGDYSANVFVSEGFVQSDFDSTDAQFSNERNTNHLFGAGLIELLAREMSAELQSLRDTALQTARQDQQTVVQPLLSKGVEFGELHAYPDGRVDTSHVSGIDDDLTIRPYSHKGVMTSLRQFTINALNHHHGIQAEERFGARWTHEEDFDEDGFAHEMTEIDVSALVAWQATLEPPIQWQPENPSWQQAADKGRALFYSSGCEHCHKSSLPLENLVFHDPGPLDTAGTLRVNESDNRRYDLSLMPWAKSLERDDQGRVLVPLFGDLKRHRIADQQVAALGNELLAQRFVERNVFMTTELWGVASTGPYGHRGDMTTLREVINAHGGQARDSREKWQALDEQQQSYLLAWLKTLRIADR